MDPRSSAAGFAQDAAHVVGGGVLADRERPADLPVAEATGDEGEDLHLARRQTVWEARSRSGGTERIDPAEERRHPDAPGQRLGLAE